MTIIREQPARFDGHTPVAVFGAGACGLVAALAARERGADVIVLEQDETPSGTTGMSYGAICAAGTELQLAAGINDSAELLHDDILAATRGATDTEHARTIAENAGPTVDWLVNRHDIDLSVEASWTGLGHQHPRLHAPANRSGQTLMNMLQAACERLGVGIVTEAQVSALYADDDSRVTGFAVTRPDGQREHMSCDAAILATCGFGANRKLVAEHIPELAQATYYGHEGNMGAGIAWGRDLGGELADMGSFQALGSLAIPQSLVMPHTLLIGGGVQINAEGERFENELHDISGQALEILRQTDAVCWMVFDQRLHEQALGTFEEYRDAEELRTAKRANSWPELAAAAGLPTSALEQTMGDVAALCESGEPDRFGRRFTTSDALHPPFYAIKVTGALFHTQGGLVVDSDARVRTAADTALPNLFAGGGAARSVSGPGGWGYLPGIGLCTAVTLGRLAGTGAAHIAASSA